MRIFITGASGWIGSAAVDELVAAGHTVVGLARSDESAAKIEAAGAVALRGELDDLDSLRRGATDADAVLYLANKHDFGNPAECDRAERAAVETLLETVAGSDAAFMVANGLSYLVDGRPALESDASPAVGPTADRGGSENLVLGTPGVRGLAIRFAPSVHGVGDWGFVHFLAGIAREHGVSGYIGAGENEWSAVHRADTARLIRLGLENAPAGTRLHAVAEEAIPTRTIAEALGEALGLPVRSIDAATADEHFGFMAEHFGLTMTGSSRATRELLDWNPTQATLTEDIRAGAYGPAT